MQVVPVSVGVASRAWDQQSLELGAAAEQVRGAPTRGFTSAVAGEAARFVAAWQRHLTALAQESETRADGLREALADYLRSDDAVGADLLVLASYVGEQR